MLPLQHLHLRQHVAKVFGVLTGAPAAVVGSAAGTAALILFRHRSNIQRLRAGTERRLGVRA